VSHSITFLTQSYNDTTVRTWHHVSTRDAQDNLHRFSMPGRSIPNRACQRVRDAGVGHVHHSLYCQSKSVDVSKEGNQRFQITRDSSGGNHTSDLFIISFPDVLSVVSADGISRRFRGVSLQWHIISLSLQKAALSALNRRVITSALIKWSELTRSTLIMFMPHTRRGFASNDKLCCNGDARFVSCVFLVLSSCYGVRYKI
jgi:hypothetical protein